MIESLESIEIPRVQPRGVVVDALQPSLYVVCEMSKRGLEVTRTRINGPTYCRESCLTIPEETSS